MTWISVKETAELLGCTERAVRFSAEKNKIDSRPIPGRGRGGIVLEIRLESLDEEYQARFRGEEKQPEDILHYTGKQREEANFKALVVMQYRASGLSPDEFVAQFNAREPREDAITKAQLFRWQSKDKQNGVAALIDQRGGYNRGKDTIQEAAWDYFYSLYMTEQQRSVKLCYDLTKRLFLDIPSVSTFERKVARIPKIATIRYREGKKAFEDKCVPSMKRSRADIASNSIWFSDHHKVDVFVKSADGKRAVRLWLTVFFDARSNKVISFIARDAAPNATVIKQCLRIGAEKYGIPNEFYFDNGADYRSKYFNRDYPLSLVRQIGIDAIYATPYHGQAKTVERFFRTFTDRFSRRFQTYTGCNAKIRPESMQVSDEKIIAQAPTIGEYIELLTAYMEEYNQTPSRGTDMNGKCPDEVYFENLKVKKVIRDMDALRLLCGNFEERTVHKNGISIMSNTYFHEKLTAHFGERVIVGYDPANISKMAVFDMENRAICMAEAKIYTPFRATTEEDYLRANKEKKAARAATKKYAPKREMGVHEIVARNQLMERDFAETGKPCAIEQIAPQAARNAKVLKATDRGNGPKRIKAEDVINALLTEKYKKQMQGG